MRVVGGWQLGSIVTWRSGFPVNPTAGVNRANTNIANDRPDATGQSISLATPTTDQWFNTAAFALQPIYNFGNAGRNTVLGPGLLLGFLHPQRLPHQRGPRAAVPLAKRSTS